MRKLLGILTVFFIFCTSVSASADDYNDWKYKFEGSASYVHLTNVYGNWGGVDLTWWARAGHKATFFVDGSFWQRDDGPQGIGGAGSYVTWTKWLYTYTSIYVGTKSEWNPRVRVDHEFNFKFGPKQFLVATAAITYFKYFDVHYDLTPQVGLSAYIANWVLTYRLFLNFSNPNWVLGVSHLVALEYGIEGAHWTALSARFGREAYLASYTLNPSKVNEWSMDVAINHRQWIGRAWGLFGEFRYTKLFGEYDQFGMLFGAFVQWGHLRPLP